MDTTSTFPEEDGAGPCSPPPTCNRHGVRGARGPSVRRGFYSLLGDEDSGPHLVHGVERRRRALAHHGPLQLQHARRVVGAALVRQLPHALVQVLHHQLLRLLQHGLRHRLDPHAAGRQL
ncbi:hypothetical protein EYF80_016119 [Liparis tanakae]|uniref:Uncharacterized protein n=1 Tax=Liparis tanakae TaxID=230148 RepID=A0A4Z2I6P9_9TELE|nr:hypothetical protein EYF80_016119 [Liparis tanakae]